MIRFVEKAPSLTSKIASFEAFHGISTDVLEWVIDKSNYVLYEKGENLFFPSKQVQHMQIIVEGSYVVYFERDGRRREAGVWGKGYITGVLPFSRMKESSAFATVLEDCYVLEFDKIHFSEMVQVSYELVQNLVSIMSSRIREFSQLRFQDEKLMALGKLSAGLAHELNNPASAMVRSAEELYRKTHQTLERFKSIITMDITPEQTDKINKIIYHKIEENKISKTQKLNLLEREERLDELLDWLDDHDIPNGDDIADVLIDFDFSTDDMENIASILSDKALEPITWWLESTLSLERLVKEIQESADRIAKLVGSVKNYSHMDRSNTKEPIDVRQGIYDTLTILKHKVKKKQIQLVKNFPEVLPKISAYGGELNQVWTNTIDNAIDAMEQFGVLQIDVYVERDYVCIDITDSGTGIPPENLTRIFEPFFTTKPMGEGTGMGLEIVKRIVDRHEGEVSVESRLGKTTFSFCFPALKDTI